MGPTTSPKAFDELQARLGAIWALNRPGVGVDHVMVALPSFSVGESLLSHYTTRIPALEHRYLLAQLVAHRIKGCEIVFVTCAPPGDVAVEYYLSLIPRERRQEVRSRIRLVVVPDRSARSVAAKLLDRPDIIERLRKSFRGRPAFIEPWNVTDAEVELALQLGAPLNGSAPDVWPLCFKSSGRRLFRQAGVPVAAGREDVRTAEDLVGAIGAIHRDRPHSSAFVVKLDDSGAGDGNVIIELGDTSRHSGMAEPIRAHVDAIPDWFMEELTAGGVVEELIQGARFSSPSVQIDIQPDGEALVLSTHEQVLGGDNQQVYVGCRFPADPAYASEVGMYGKRVGDLLAARGARGRCSVDFAAAQLPSGRWTVVALEINLRKGGTTHPFAVLRNLVPGVYSAEAGRWISSDGSPRFYSATDNLVDEKWQALAPERVIDAVKAAGFDFDLRKGTGVVLHMLSGLAIDGRFGLTAVGRSPEEASELFDGTAEAVRQEVKA